MATALTLMLMHSTSKADNDVTEELRDQNTPTGWTAVSLPVIPEITTENTITITDAAYGASISSTDNTAAIQAALDAVPSTGGMVVVPAGTFLCGPITIKSKTVLHLAAGATLKLLPYGNGTDGTTASPEGCYPTNGTNSSGLFNYKMFITCTKNTSTTDIIVEGEGTTSVIDGQGEDWWDKRSVLGTRPPLIRFEKGSRFLFRNFKLLNSPGVNLTLGNGGGATDFTVHDITISNPSSESSQLASGEVVSHNTDGIPVWGARCNIYNCDISTGDDNIVTDSHAQYVHAWNITCGYGHGMSMGSYTEQMHDIIYEGITFTNTTAGFRIKTANGRSGNKQSGTDSNGAVENIICRNSTMTGVKGPIKITSWYDTDPSDPSSCGSTTVTYQTPEFCNITFQNIQSTGTTGSTVKSCSPIYLYGLPEINIHDITFDNVQISAQLGMFLAYCSGITFTNGCKITNTKNSSTLVGTSYSASISGSYDGTETATTYEVKFMNGSSTYFTESICANSYAYPPSAPTKAGYDFKGWATSEDGTAVSLAATQLSTGGTYYALWESNGESVEEETIFSLTNTATSSVTIGYGQDQDLASYATISGGSALIHNGHSSTDAAMITADGYKCSNSGGSYIKLVLDKAIATGDVLTTIGGDGGLVAAASSNTATDNISDNTFTFTSDYAGKTEIYICRGSSKPTISAITITHTTEISDDGSSKEDTPAPIIVSTKKKFDFIVGTDGDADAAIAAANAASGSDRYYIFVPNGTYDMATKQTWTLGSEKSAISGTDGSTVNPGESFSNNATWLTRSNVSIIGQSMSGTILRNTPIYPGISYTSTLEIRSGKTNTYLQDFTLYNNYADGANDKGVAVAFYDRGTNTILKNVKCWSNQDTYTSAATRCYYETSSFAGTVDFICGSGDVWFEKPEIIINDRSGNVITAPATASTEEWGYVFNKATVSAATGATKCTSKSYNLGRPWKNAPASTFLYTTFNLLPSDAGWTNMTSNLDVRFHEYGSMDSSGAALDLSTRSVSACSGANSDDPVLTSAQAVTYTVADVVGNNGTWTPKNYTLQTSVSNVVLNGSTLTWDDNDYALCWVVFKNGSYYANPTTNSIELTESGSYTVRAANYMGGLGTTSDAVSYTASVEKYTITAYATKGSIAIANGNAAVESGSEVDNMTSLTLTATANSGYEFSQWSDGNTENPRTLTVNGTNVSLTALFVAKYSLSASTSTTETSAKTYTFNNGFSISNTNDKTYSAVSGTDYIKYSATQYTVSIPAGVAVTKISFIGYDNYSEADSYIKEVNGTDYSTSDYVFPAKNSDGTTNIVTQTITLNESAVGSLTFTVGGKQCCFTIDIYGYDPYTVTIPSSGLGSFSCPEGLDISNATSSAAEVLKAYYGKSKSDTSLRLTNIEKVPANEGIILQGTPGGTYIIPVYTGSMESIDNLLQGTSLGTFTVTSSLPDTYYGFNSGEFKKVDASANDVTIPSYKAFLKVANSSNAKFAFFFDDDEATGIKFTHSQNDNDAVYNISGQRVEKTYRGIAIKNGTKIFIK